MPVYLNYNGVYMYSLQQSGISLAAASTFYQNWLRQT